LTGDWGFCPPRPITPAGEAEGEPSTHCHMTTLIATISILAAVIGIAGIVPQLITML
jgi:hypothetical protein